MSSRESGPLNTATAVLHCPATSRGRGFWIPAFAGTTLEYGAQPASSLALRENPGSAFHQRLGRGVGVGQKPVDLLPRDRRNVEALAHSVGEECVVLHRGIEGGPQRSLAVIRNAGRR